MTAVNDQLETITTYFGLRAKYLYLPEPAILAPMILSLRPHFKTEIELSTAIYHCASPYLLDVPLEYKSEFHEQIRLAGLQSKPPIKAVNYQDRVLTAYAIICVLILIQSPTIGGLIGYLVTLGILYGIFRLSVHLWPLPHKPSAYIIRAVLAFLAQMGLGVILILI